MASFVPTSEETLDDRRHYTEDRMVEVSCLDCLAKVRVKKNSEHHTSVQWSGQSWTDCQEFVRRDQQPGGRDMHKPCPRMMASIDDAVRAGAVPIGAFDGY
ncbi:hypothetical protein GCM10022237_10010 [Nocardioides ginsengisoli]|uniref:Ferredoxin n=1 Tax=Nocardioides ginsengisoli TaxID=363868 RepID=A0ABW3VZU5_9ACTN